MFLRLGNAGWYVVKKDIILFRAFSFCRKAYFRSVNLTSEIITRDVQRAACVKKTGRVSFCSSSSSCF